MANQRDNSSPTALLADGGEGLPSVPAAEGKPPFRLSVVSVPDPARWDDAARLARQRLPHLQPTFSQQAA